MMAQWVLVDSPLYRMRLETGWRDTGFVREWCGGTVICVMMVKE